jgi:hypothetical protein
MDSSNQKWQFHIMAMTNRTCSGKTLVQIISNSKGSSQPEEERNMVAKDIDLDYGIKTNCIYAATIDAGQIYTDQTGHFPVISSKVNKYIMVLYEYDGNAILAEPIKNRTSP